MTFSALSLASPWMLSALIGLPVLWWLLRATPPAPKHLKFPAIQFLMGLEPTQRTPARTPWWLLLLRLAIVALIVMGLARPLLNAPQQIVDDPHAPLMIVLDDGWASGAGWRTLQDAAVGFLGEPSRTGRPVILLTTSGAPDARAPLAPRPAVQVQAEVQAMTPKPWATNRSEARAALGVFQSGELAKPGQILWLHDGLEDESHGGPASSNAQELAAALRDIAPLRVLIDDEPTHRAVLLDPPSATAPVLETRVRRSVPKDDSAIDVWVRLLDEQGRVIARAKAAFAAGEATAIVQMDPPRLAAGESAKGSGSRAVMDLSFNSLDAIPSAGARALLEDQWSPRTVGLVLTDGAPSAKDGVPLLAPYYYIEKALLPHAEVIVDPLQTLLNQKPGVLILADIAPLSPDQEKALGEWVSAGGLLVRFASARQESRTDDLLPVRLRGGDRNLGGALSWSDPAHLAAFPVNSPFVGLTVPADVTVTTQILATPEPGLEERTWAILDDGTPLVTTAQRGAGRIVLFHVTPNPDWSNLPLSLLFEQMLERIVTSANGTTPGEGTESRPRPPWRVLNGLGRLGPAGPDDRMLPPEGPGPVLVAPGLPPGLYGDETNARALNLAPSVTSLSAVSAWPEGNTVVASLSRLEQGKDLSGWLLGTALALILLDLLVSLSLRGFLRLPGRARTWIVALFMATGSFCFTLGASPVSAQTSGGPTVSEKDRDAALEPRLAFVLTGNAAVDAVSEAGLTALSAVLARRTNAELAPPIPLDPERDDPLLFPVVYWPLTTAQPPLSSAAIQRFNRYLHTGGLLVMDSRGDPGAVQRLAGGLDIPPLMQLNDTHVLARSFYLLSETPGRTNDSRAWVARTTDDNDGVSPVVIGDNDWAAAWAHTPRDGYLFAVTPGSEQQREMAYRFGVNVVIYALTGNYKGDQLHTEALLQKLEY